MSNKNGKIQTKNKIKTNRKSLNKSVRKKEKVNFIQLTFSQYENILISDMTSARIFNLLKVNCDKDFINNLRKNKVPEYSEWFKKVRGV
ncbi:hypothetical protein HHA33_22055 [Phytobacter diazotrophicus]|jgi:hypothetical protein|uniref:hypothetical protein n=1 Tax=Phytobacter diazotrophicus TaxID=395631 RepID=UPI0014519A70|nr:hypothetical protein [Phytobacter diazotrophicus]QJF19070.1 hypothetical protein HHA33_22055 [Phytobacter diazotrophicus]